jgi:hypothetical protein
MSLRMGLDCCDLAGIIPTPPLLPVRLLHAKARPVREEAALSRILDLNTFGKREERMVKSWFPTQNVKTSRPVLESSDGVSSNPILHPYLLEYPDYLNRRSWTSPCCLAGPSWRARPCR